jgi:hypothetical protein
MDQGNNADSGMGTALSGNGNGNKEAGRAD